MRAALALLLVTACTPDIVSGSYLCGPNASCPEDMACNGTDNHCVLESTAKPFECTPATNTEPDDNVETAQVLTLSCNAPPFPSDNCMPEGDTQDWVKFKVPADCTNVGLTTRVSFPLAFQRLGLEIWNVDTMTQLGSDTDCPIDGEPGDELRCFEQNLTPGTTYGIKVHPAGDGDCDGKCSYNRYTLRVQLVTSG
jgi:hypothetical protein